jgi:hypothetical protein
VNQNLIKGIEATGGFIEARINAHKQKQFLCQVAQ